MSDVGPRGPQSDRITITDSNLNPVLQIVSWLLLAFSTMVLLFRLFTNILIKAQKPSSLEDLLFLSAFVFAVAETITMVIPASNILGKDMDLITRDELITGLKAQYARDFLFILSLSMAKLSACRNIFILSPNYLHRLLARITAGLIGLWMIVCIFATAFQCGTQGPWGQEEIGSQCVNQHALLTFMWVMSIITDAALVVLPVFIIFPLHMGLEERMTVMLFYCSRILTIAATICQIIYIPRLPDANYTRHAFAYSVCVQVVQFLSFAAVCVVYFWPFIKSLQGGLERSSDTNMVSQYVLNASHNKSRTTGGGVGGGGGRTSKGAASLLMPPGSGQRADRANYIELTTDSAGSNSKKEQKRPSNAGSGVS
ncbi:hypothetical protein F4778DRAFT_771912 [Xylariomycetidae sp. FL2044]|nr:hypothetical protein F4778DRAFT_771912 [Xylariomycetidae sp. FL2044]